MKRFATWAILILSFFGLIVAAYIAQHEATNTPLLCNIQNLTGCNIVAQSQYSKLFSIPLADYGLLFFGLLFFVAALELVLYHHLARRVMQIFAIIGFVFSAYFVAIQIFVIKALCIYCLASAAIALMVFLLSFLLEPVQTALIVRKAPQVPMIPPPPPPRLPMPPRP